MGTLGFIIALISGGVGGYLVGLAWKEKSLGRLWNIIVGVIGGVIGAWIAYSLNLLGDMSVPTMTVQSILGEAGVSALFGAILTSVVGIIKKAGIK